MKRNFPRWLREALDKFDIVCDRNIVSGQPCVRGRRIPVFVIAGRYSAGESMESIAKDFTISVKQVRNAIRFWLRTSRVAGMKLWKYLE